MAKSHRRLHLPVLPPDRLPRPQAHARPSRMREGQGWRMPGIARRVGRRLLASRAGAARRRRRHLRADARAARRPGGVLRLRPQRRARGDRGAAAQMGLDQPDPGPARALPRPTSRTGNLGRSMTTGQPVTTDMRAPPAGLARAHLHRAAASRSALALPLGIAAALRPGSLVDHAVRMLCTLGVCVPTFVSGLLLIYAFYYLLGWAPDPTGAHRHLRRTPPDITGFYLIDFALVGDWEGWRAAFDAAACCRPAPWRCSCWRRWRA